MSLWKKNKNEVDFFPSFNLASQTVKNQFKLGKKSSSSNIKFQTRGEHLGQRSQYISIKFLFINSVLLETVW